MQLQMLDAIRNRWPEYLIEAWCLGMFMISASAFGVLLFESGSPATALDSTIRNLLMGIAMGLTAIAIITSRWGRRSGAHFNPAVTLTFLRLKRIGLIDAAFYILFQFIGGLAGMVLSWFLLGDRLEEAAVNFVVTVPGAYGAAGAFIAEETVSFLMMSMILFTGRSPRMAKLTPVFAGILLSIFIAIAAPISGLSMNPARTFASAVLAGNWTGWWIYFVAPITAMIAASELFLRIEGLKNGVAVRPKCSDGIGVCESKGSRVTA
jgi:aquaporin Z